MIIIHIIQIERHDQEKEISLFEIIPKHSYDLMKEGKQLYIRKYYMKLKEIIISFLSTLQKLSLL